MLLCHHSSVTRIEVEVNTHFIRQSTSACGIDRSRRLTAQVTDSKGVVGEKHGAFLAKEESGDETVCAIYRLGAERSALLQSRYSICEGINQSAVIGKPLQLWLPTGIELRNSSLFLTAGICYHAPTRTGPASPIRSHFESIVFCDFLWS